MTINLTAIVSETFEDVARALTGKRRPKKHGAVIASGLIAISYALHTSHLSATEFGRRFVDRDSKSDLIFKWLAGKTVPSRAKIELIDQAFPGTLNLYDHAFFRLLADLPMTVGEIRNHLAPFTWDGPLGPAWQFRDDSRPERKLLPFLTRDHTPDLLPLHTLDAATAILGLVREAEAQGRTMAHMLRISDLYRILPSITAQPWFRQHRRLVWWCVQRIHAREMISYGLLKVRWGVLRRLSQADIQSRMSDRHFRLMLWRWLHAADIDVVEQPSLFPPRSLRNPLLPRRQTKVVTPKRSRTKTARASRESLENRLREILGLSDTD